ncbi:MAG: PAS domain-containing sensor histidine kinase [Promethearchaeota archaeon]|nr:MAG: PAS domain-containing sensor histidine kinase [Candidatus Lokiarchaeota archaeon]
MVNFINGGLKIIEEFDAIAHFIAMLIFITGITSTSLIFWKKKTVSSIFLVFLMIGGFLYTLGDVIATSGIWVEETADEFGDSFTIFLASIILIIGFIVILEQKLKTSEQKFRHLFENSPYPVLLLELNRTIKDCNIATLELFETKKANLTGVDFSEFFIDPLKLSNLLKERVDFMIKGKNLKPLELKLQKKKESFAWVSLQTSLFEVDNEIFLQIILQDITDRKKAEEIIKDEMKKLKEIDQIRSDFVRRTSHELKTPLISIYSSSQYLLDNLNQDLNEETLTLIESINRGGKRLKRLTENLIDVFNLETNLLIIQKEEVDLVKIINNCIKDMFLILKERNIFHKLELNDSCYIQADKIRIEQVILNMLSNAIKNTPQNGLIYIGLNKTKDFVNIVFKDSGIGFTEEEKEKIFKKFGKIERVDIQNDIIIEGSGLGLYISKQIIELHDGEIWMESEGRNKGSAFTIKLPLN